jgi:predicted amidophosphoribosyltransferase
MQEAFVVEAADKVKAKNVLLVDDILTTGATMTAAASVVRKAGAARIFGLTWATGFDNRL